jgi:hypothetical protein
MVDLSSIPEFGLQLMEKHGAKTRAMYHEAKFLVYMVKSVWEDLYNFEPQ